MGNNGRDTIINGMALHLFQLLIHVARSGSNRKAKDFAVLHQKAEWELLLWFRGLRTRQSVHKDGSLIPGLTPWVKNLVLLRLWRRLAAAAVIHPQPKISTCLRCKHEKEKKKKLKKQQQQRKAEQSCRGPSRPSVLLQMGKLSLTEGAEMDTCDFVLLVP